MSESNPRSLEEAVRLAWSEAPEGCPALELLVAVGAGEAESAVAAGVKEHADSCPRCAAEIALATSFAVGEEASGAPPAGDVDEALAKARSGRSVVRDATRDSPTRRMGGRSFTALRLAAAVVAVAGAVVLLRSPEAPPLPPAPAGTTVARGGALELIAPLGDLETPPAEWSWRGVEDARAYRVTVSRVDGRVLWQRSTADTRIDGGELPSLPVGVRLEWQVEALGPDGEEVPARSAVGEVRLLGEAEADGASLGPPEP